MFNIIFKQIQFATWLVGGVAVATQVWEWLIGQPVNRGSPTAWAFAWLFLVIWRSFEKLAAWERVQQGLPEPSESYERTREPNPIPLETRVRELVAKGKQIEALRDIRAEGMSLDDARAYLTRVISDESV
jgi:hypothetical protein